MLNPKFLINESLNFAKNNVNDATKMLAQMIDDSMLPANGELLQMSETIQEIISTAKQFKEFLGRVKEVDLARKNIIEVVKENKEAVVV